MPDKQERRQTEQDEEGDVLCFYNAFDKVSMMFSERYVSQQKGKFTASNVREVANQPKE